MGQYVIKMPDIGEGIAEVELVHWYVKPGDMPRRGLSDSFKPGSTIETSLEAGSR